MSGAPTLKGLYVHPIKSCRGIALQRAQVVGTGLAHDREWMLVDPSGRFITQREQPRLTQVGTALDDDCLHISITGHGSLRVPLDHQGEVRQVEVWRSRVSAFDAGAEAAAFFSGWLGLPARLVRFDPAQRRFSNRDWTGGIAAPNLFSDGYPVLVLSEASRLDLSARVGANLTVERFRPNLLLDHVPAYAEDAAATLQAGAVTLRLGKPCTRCVITTLDPDTGESGGDEPLRTLRTYRYDAALRGVTFGRNAVLLPGSAGQWLQVGQTLQLG
jgi:hypothetical protein